MPMTSSMFSLRLQHVVHPDPRSGVVALTVRSRASLSATPARVFFTVEFFSDVAVGNSTRSMDSVNVGSTVLSLGVSKISRPM